ncbi:adenine deaminase [Rhizobium bangladeshense]|uniref:adenine deaminase n=1 Tax=Rhizobium bangladeshense TaxID=1138189 RepID=UPI0007E5597E|nr:adenine deaminase C-terminal domain-containing protein [Rhizobium bangladeshense]
MNTIPRPEPADLNDPALRARAVAAARGDAPFDMLITGGRLLDAVTGLIRDADIGLVGALIASVHASASRADAAEVIDAAGSILTPGLIDTHMHVESSMVTPAEYASAVLPRGVTTVVWDPHEFGNVHGLDGVRWAIEAARALPLRMILLAPSCVPSAPGLEIAGADFDAAVIAEMLRSSAVGGVAEVMNMRGVIDGDPRMSAIVNAGLASGKLVCGHARGLEGADLNAFMAAGVTSDHELTSGADLATKLAAGLTIELRGSHDHLLQEFVEVLNGLGHLPPTVTLCTDDVFPDELYESGGLDDVARRLVRYGMKPEWAIQAATFNAAQRLKRSDLGLVAAGRRADLVFFEDLAEFRARLVISGGRIVARNGSMEAVVEPLDTAPLTNSVKLPTLTENDFRIPAKGNRVRVATIDRPRFTEWGEAETEVRDGFVVPPAGSAMIAVAHRHGKADGITRVGFLTGWGEWRGAFCTTVSHDSHNLTVFGGNARDMALAANAVISAGGGMAVAGGGKIEAILSLPLSGLVTDASLQDTASAFAGIRKAMDKIVDWKPPYRVFKACFGATLACNAGPHQTDRGIADVVTGRVMEGPVLEVLWDSEHKPDNDRRAR